MEPGSGEPLDDTPEGRGGEAPHTTNSLRTTNEHREEGRWYDAARPIRRESQT